MSEHMIDIARFNATMALTHALKCNYVANEADKALNEVIVRAHQKWHTWRLVNPCEPFAHTEKFAYCGDYSKDLIQYLHLIGIDINANEGTVRIRL